MICITSIISVCALAAFYRVAKETNISVSHLVLLAA